MSKYNRLFNVFLVAALLASHTLLLSAATVSTAVSAASWQSKVDAWVMQTAAEGPTEFLIVLAEQADLSAAKSLPDKLAKGEFVYRTASGLAARTQPPLWDALARMGAAYRSYWIVNMIWVRGDLSAVQTMAQRADVAHIYANPTVRADLPQPSAAPGPNAPGTTVPAAIEWNINKVSAPQVWAAGYTGQGVVIGGADTGYVWNHPALKNQYRGWNGAAADHNYNWLDATAENSPTPIDPYGHGTHTMGTMVGSDNWADPANAANAVGMAPGARWIGCRNMNTSGYGTPATYITCYEWFIAPYPVGGTPAQGDPAKAPDVISNSWGCTSSEGCSAVNWNVLLPVVQAVRAAGIVTVHSAGNYGSSCNTIFEPAAIYAESFTVGATDSGDSIASFSSRGPVTVDGSNRIKPNVSAPGVGVRSTTNNGFYGSSSGTSMAAPHVAGMIALLISSQPRLAGDVEALETLIEQTTLPLTTAQTCGGVPGSSIPNNTFGYGRINAYDAMLNVPHSLEIGKTAPEFVAPGQTITYTLTITHQHSISPTANVVLSDTIPTGTTFVSASAGYSLVGDTLRWDFPSLAANQSASVQWVAQATLPSGAITNQGYGVASDDVPYVAGLPVTTTVVPYSLELGVAAPASIAPGGILTYTLTVTNPHPVAAQHSLVMTDVLPADVNFISATEPYSLVGERLTWEKPALDAGAVWSVELAVQVPLTFTGTITNLDYGVRSSEAAPVGGLPVTTQIYSLAVGKIAAPAAAPGGLLTYTLTVTNLHPISSTHTVVLTDVLPAGVTLIGSSEPFTPTDGIIQWERASLAALESWPVTLTVQIPLTMTAGTIGNIAYGARSVEALPVTGAPVYTEITPFTLSVGKTGPASVLPGGLLTYTLTVTNLHPFAAAHNLILTDTLPAQTTFVSATGSYITAGGVVTWTLPTLPVGDTWEVALVVQAASDASGSIVNAQYGARCDGIAQPASGAPAVAVIEPFRRYLPVVRR